MPTAKPKKLTDSLRSILPSAASIGAPHAPPRFAEVASPSLASAAAHLETLREDLKRTIAEQLRLEKENAGSERPALLQVIGSRAILERKIAEAERRVEALHHEQAQRNADEDAEAWRELLRARALAVLHLRKCNAALEARFKSYKSAGAEAEVIGFFGPAADYTGAASWGYRLLGSRDAPGHTGVGAKAFLRECATKGIISERELSENE